MYPDLTCIIGLVRRLTCSHGSSCIVSCETLETVPYHTRAVAASPVSLEETAHFNCSLLNLVVVLKQNLEIILLSSTFKLNVSLSTPVYM